MFTETCYEAIILQPCMKMGGDNSETLVTLHGIEDPTIGKQLIQRQNSPIW